MHTPTRVTARGTSTHDRTDADTPTRTAQDESQTSTHTYTQEKVCSVAPWNAKHGSQARGCLVLGGSASALATNHSCSSVSERVRCDIDVLVSLDISA